MSTQKRNRTGKAKRGPRTRGTALREEPSGELDRLRSGVRGDRQLVDGLLTVDRSLATAGLLEQARGRYEQNLHRTCDILEERLGNAEKRIGELEDRNRTLEAANEQLIYKAAKLLLELRQALGVTATTRDKDHDQQASPETALSTEDKPKQVRGGKRGAPKGHRGRTRPVPATVDKEQVIAPAEVCECGCSDITPLLDFDARYIEDIPPVSKEVTCQIYLQGRCQQCGKVVRHPDAISRPPVVTGPNLAAHLTMLNHMGMTFRKLSVLSTQTLGIDLSPSGALGIVNRVGVSLQGPYGELLAALPDQDWLNGDETGWKVMGRSGYIWCFCNSDIAFFHHDYRRSAKVIEEILGESFAGVVICDFYAAYNCIGTTQRCLVHLLRDIKKEREILAGSKLLERFDEAVKSFIQEGLTVQAMTDGHAKERAIRKLEKRLDRLTRMKVTKGKATTLVKRIGKYRDDLIRFVTHPGVEFHNNRAERQLRPIVVNRKVSFGSNTDHGARRYCVIHTIVETCKLQGVDPIDYLRRAYTSGGLDVPSLVGADPPVAA
ncbi:MAG: IS66 family transposase [Candidatus Marinimicrobia bacterium]|nr:IS66 family transposase [Lentisphaerota bacterium]MBT7088837.1 IS66 family transposase [Candidatus Neomarinimicrobiota bacterium]